MADMYFSIVPTNIGIYYYIDTLKSTQDPSNIQYMMCVCLHTCDGTPGLYWGFKSQYIY